MTRKLREIDMSEKLPDPDEQIELPSGEIKLFGECTTEDILSVIQAIEK